MDASTPAQAAPLPGPDRARGAATPSTAGQRAALVDRLQRHVAALEGVRPSLMLTDTAFLRNPHYHRTTDTSATLDYSFMAMVTEATAGAVARLSDAT
jgi:hypothetical protein